MIRKIAVTGLTLGIFFCTSACGGGGSSGSGSAGNPPSGTTVDLTTTTTTTAVDTTIPPAAVTNIDQIVSSADSEALGQPLAIPTNSAGFATPIFAVDSGENVLLASCASSGQTTFSASSTAATFVILTLGTLPNPGPSYIQVTQDVQSAAGFPVLVTDIEASLASGAPPLNSQTVLQDVATVVNQVVPVIASQSGSESRSSVHANDVTILPTETAAPPLPFQILGPFPSKPTLFSVYIVYIASATTQRGVNLINTMPIAFHASSTDENGNPIVPASPGITLPAADLWLGQLKTPNAVAIEGNGQTFIVTVDGTDSSTRVANFTLSAKDWLVFIVGQVTGLNRIKLPGLDDCAQQGAKAIVNELVSTNANIFTSPATGAQVSSTIALSLSGTTIYQAVKIAISCAAPSISTSSAALAAIKNLPKLVGGPISAVWKGVQFVASAYGPVTEAALTFYYWNKVQPVQVCEAGGAVVSCPGLSLTATFTVTPLAGATASWSGSDTLTMTPDGNWVWSGNLSEQGPCPGSRTESGSGTYSLPVPPSPPAPFSFNVGGYGVQWTNTDCGGTYGGSTAVPPVTVDATPATGGYTLSTNTVYAPQAGYGGSQMTVTVSGFLATN